MTDEQKTRIRQAGQPLSHMNNLGNTMVRNLKKHGLVFKENEDL